MAPAFQVWSTSQLLLIYMYTQSHTSVTSASKHDWSDAFVAIAMEGNNVREGKYLLITF